MTNNRRNALWLSGLSLAISLLALLFFAAGASFSPFSPLLVLESPVVLILAFAPLIGMLGVVYKNKEVLIISSLLSIALTVLGIVSIGVFFVAPSLFLIASTFVYLSDEPAAEANEKARKTALIAALVSLFTAIAAMAPIVSFRESVLALAFGALFYLFPLIPPILGMVGIRNRNREFLFASSAISLVLAIFLMLLLHRLLFLASSALLVLSALAYQSGITGEIKMETTDARLKKIAILLAGISLVAAMAATLYSELILISGGCYSYQTSPTSGGRICGDFRVDYVIPVIISVVAMAGILRDNKLLLYASGTISFARVVTYLQPIANLFIPSFVALIVSALIYKMGIRRLEYQVKVQESREQFYVLLLISAVAIFWIIAVYIFVHPSSTGMSSGYDYEQLPAKQAP